MNMKENSFGFSAESLGAGTFRAAYNIQYSYVSGSMYKGISSYEMVIRMGLGGMLGFFGTGGLDFSEIESGIQAIQSRLNGGESYGVNLIHSPGMPLLENASVDLFLSYGVKVLEASAFMQVTPAVVKYRLLGLRRDSNGVVHGDHRIIAKVSRPEVASAFLHPAPENIVNQLLASKQITEDQAMMAKEVPVANDICVEADSGGHTDMGIATVLVPTIKRLKDEICKAQNYQHLVHLGAAGGIGTPEAAAAMFVLGADFIVTGSINQCTIESGASDEVKSLLQDINVQDTAYAPAGDMFEMGARVQVMKLGTFFPARANKLYELWKNHNSLEEIDAKTIKQIEAKYFKRSIDEVYAETKAFYLKVMPYEIEKAEKSPKHKMALIFRWYFIHSNRVARAGDDSERINYQVHTGPALGAFNQWVKGTELEDWRNRQVDEIGLKIMQETALYMEHSLAS